MEPFDTIIGAEVLFREEFFKPLLGILRNYLAPGGTVYLAHNNDRRSLAPFLEMASEYFKIGTIARKISTEDTEITILLNRLAPLVHEVEGAIPDLRITGTSCSCRISRSTRAIRTCCTR